MANVVTPFMRRRNATEHDQPDPRHRRNGYFDEQDRWRDADESKTSADAATP